MPTLVDGIPHTLSTRAAAILNELAPNFECVWCTGWEDRADTHLPVLLGLPRGWPHITFPETASPHWKLAGIDAFAGPDRPLAWIDDQHDHACRAWAAARRGPTLLVTTVPASRPHSGARERAPGLGQDIAYGCVVDSVNVSVLRYVPLVEVSPRF